MITSKTSLITSLAPPLSWTLVVNLLLQLPLIWFLPIVICRQTFFVDGSILRVSWWIWINVNDDGNSVFLVKGCLLCICTTIMGYLLERLGLNINFLVLVFLHSPIFLQHHHGPVLDPGGNILCKLNVIGSHHACHKWSWFDRPPFLWTNIESAWWFGPFFRQSGELCPRFTLYFKQSNTHYLQ